MKDEKQKLKPETIPHKVILDVPTCKVFPLELANFFRDNSERRNTIHDFSETVMGISLMVLCVDVVFSLIAKEDFVSSTTFMISSISIFIVGIALICWCIYIWHNFYDFAECDDHQYGTIAEHKKNNTEIASYTETIKASGREWISNYELRAMQSFLNAKEVERQRVADEEKLDAARVKAFE